MNNIILLFSPKNQLVCCNLYKNVYVRQIQAAFVRQNHNQDVVERHLEVPVIVVSEKNNVDIIGPPDPKSNLRPIIRKRALSETKLQHKLRTMQDATQAWNHEFWANHNMNFIKQREDYIKKHHKQGDQPLTADEMSNFYKEFLDANWERHFKYNFEWYQRNFALLMLALKVNVEKVISKLKSSLNK